MLFNYLYVDVRAIVVALFKVFCSLFSKHPIGRVHSDVKIGRCIFGQESHPKIATIKIKFRLIFISDGDNMFLFVFSSHKRAIVKIKHIVRTKSVNLHTVDVFDRSRAARTRRQDELHAPERHLTLQFNISICNLGIGSAVYKCPRLSHSPVVIKLFINGSQSAVLLLHIERHGAFNLANRFVILNGYPLIVFRCKGRINRFHRFFAFNGITRIEENQLIRSLHRFAANDGTSEIGRFFIRTSSVHRHQTVGSSRTLIIV